MSAAYHGGIDAEISERYRTYDGCKLILEKIRQLRDSDQQSFRALARHRGRGIGFIVLTEIAARRDIYRRWRCFRNISVKASAACL